MVIAVGLVSNSLLLFQGKMIMQDKLEKERNDAKNAVEEYVYEMRDKLSGEYEKFVSEDVSVPLSFCGCRETFTL